MDWILLKLRREGFRVSLGVSALVQREDSGQERDRSRRPQRQPPERKRDGDRAGGGEKWGETQAHKVPRCLTRTSQAKSPEQGMPRAGQHTCKWRRPWEDSGWKGVPYSFQGPGTNVSMLNATISSWDQCNYPHWTDKKTQESEKLGDVSQGHRVHI